MSELVEVAFMGMSLNSLSDLDEEGKKSLEDAQLINLHMNNLSNLEGLRTITTVTALNLSSNSFTSTNIPELCLLPNLTTLDLASNYIQYVHDFPFLPQLQTLSLAYNKIKSLDGIESCSGLIKLDVRANMIANFVPGLSALNSLPFLVHLDLGGVRERHSNPITPEYTKNIDTILRLVPDLEFLDKKQVTNWPSYSETSKTMFQEVKTPKFDKLYERFKPPNTAVLTNELDKNNESIERPEIPPLENDVEFPQKHVTYTEIHPDDDINAKNDSADNEVMVQIKLNDKDDGNTHYKSATTSTVSTSPMPKKMPVVLRDQATSPKFTYDQDTDSSIVAMRELTAKLDANLQTRSIATATSPTLSASVISPTVLTSENDNNCWNVESQSSSILVKQPVQFQKQLRRPQEWRPQPAPFLSLSELDKEMQIPLSHHAINTKKANPLDDGDADMFMNSGTKDENVEEGNSLSHESNKYTKYILPCSSIINTLNNFRRRRQYQVIMKLWANAMQPLTSPPPPTVDEGEGSYMIGSLDDPTDTATQTEEPILSTFPNIQREVEIVESRYKIQEKESTAKFLEIELKYKNDLAYRTQLVEATEKKRLHSMLHLNEQIEALKTKMIEMKNVHDEGTEKLIEEKESLEEHLVTSRNENTCLKDKVSELQALLLEADQQKHNSAIEASTLREELKNMRNHDNDEVILLRSKVKSLEDSLNTSNEALSNERRSYSDQNTQLIHIVREQSGEIERLIAAKDDAMKVKMDDEKNIELLKAENQHLIESIKTLRIENIDKIRYLEDKVNRQRDALFELRNVATELRDSREIEMKKSKEMELALQLSKEQARETKIQSDNINRNLNEKLLQLERDFSSLSIVNGKVAMNPIKFSELEAKIQELESALKIKGTILDDQNLAIKSLKDQKLEMESKLKESMNIIDTLDEDIRGLKKIIKDNEAQLEKKSLLEVDLRKLIKELSADVLKYDDNLKIDMSFDEDEDDVISDEGSEMEDHHDDETDNLYVDASMNEELEMEGEVVEEISMKG